MNIFITILLIINLLFHLNVSTKYYRLYQNNIIHTDSRISFKILNKVLESNQNQEETKMILKCKKNYTISVFLFYSTLLSIAISIFQTIK
jgi:hypothetical protein